MIGAEEKNTGGKLPHHLILEERNALSVSGVEEVRNFDETQVELLTSMGELVICGEHLRIDRTDTRTGELLLHGEVSELSYRTEEKGASGIWGRLFH